MRLLPSLIIQSVRRCHVTHERSACEKRRNIGSVPVTNFFFFLFFFCHRVFKYVSEWLKGFSKRRVISRLNIPNPVRCLRGIPCSLTPDMNDRCHVTDNDRYVTGRISAILISVSWHGKDLTPVEINRAMRARSMGNSFE